MKELKKLLGKIPDALASTPSVFIFIFLFVYLFIFGVAGLFIRQIEPSADTQLILGNYTNVLSALGAALAAGAGSKHAKSLKDLHKKHDKFQMSLDELHHKIDSLAGDPKKK